MNYANLKLVLGIALIIISLNRAMAGLVVEPTTQSQGSYYYGGYYTYGYGYYSSANAYKKCIGNTIYIERTTSQGTSLTPLYSCGTNEQCIDGDCIKKPTRINIGSWELSFGPWCSEKYVSQYCIGDEVWGLYRNSKCVTSPQFIQRCQYGCNNGVCNTAKVPVYYYQYYTYQPQQTQVTTTQAQYAPTTYTYTYSYGRPSTQQSCSTGYVCVDASYKAYRSNNCEIISSTYTYCQYGCKDGACQQPRYTTTSIKYYRDCDNDGDCPPGYYCKHTFAYDRCIPIWGDP